MSALEQEVIEKFRQLDHEARQRVFVVIQGELNADTVMEPFDQWLVGMEQLRQEIVATFGEGYEVDVQGLLDEIREEASWPRIS